jgi:hypothetical protein
MALSRIRYFQMYTNIVVLYNFIIIHTFLAYNLMMAYLGLRMLWVE